MLSFNQGKGKQGSENKGEMKMKLTKKEASMARFAVETLLEDPGTDEAQKKILLSLHAKFQEVEIAVS